jgi:predicted nucleic acid-binding protein
MKRFLDASILVEACLAQSPQFAAADALVKTNGAVTSAHALAEAYATLSGDVRLKIKSDDASRMVGDLAHALQVHALAAKPYVELIRDAPAKGIFGGSFFDAFTPKRPAKPSAPKFTPSTCGTSTTLPQTSP